MARIYLRERLPQLNDICARSFTGLDVGPTPHLITNLQMAKEAFPVRERVAIRAPLYPPLKQGFWEFD